MLSQEGYISIWSYFVTVRYYPWTNHDSSNNTSQNHDIFFFLLASQVLMISSIPTYSLLQLSKLSKVTWDSSMNKNFEKSNFMWSSAYFRWFCTCIYVNGSFVTDVLTFSEININVVEKFSIDQAWIIHSFIFNLWLKIFGNNPWVIYIGPIMYLCRRCNKFFHSIFQLFQFFKCWFTFWKFRHYNRLLRSGQVTFLIHNCMIIKSLTNNLEH